MYQSIRKTDQTGIPHLILPVAKRAINNYIATNEMFHNATHVQGTTKPTKRLDHIITYKRLYLLFKD